jgi:hypothetical protein
MQRQRIIDPLIDVMLIDLREYQSIASMHTNGAASRIILPPGSIRIISRGNRTRSGWQ